MDRLGVIDGWLHLSFSSIQFTKSRNVKLRSSSSYLCLLGLEFGHSTLSSSSSSWQRQVRSLHSHPCIAVPKQQRRLMYVVPRRPTINHPSCGAQTTHVTHTCVPTHVCTYIPHVCVCTVPRQHTNVMNRVESHFHSDHVSRSDSMISCSLPPTKTRTEP